MGGFAHLKTLVSTEEHEVMANGEPCEEDHPIILIAAPDEELLEREDFQKSRERIRMQFNSLSTAPENHPLMNNLTRNAEKLAALIDKKVTVEMTHTPDSIFVDTQEQIGISDTSYSLMHVEGKDKPFDEPDGTRDTYLITKDDDSWIGVFLYDSGSTFSFEEAQGIVQGVFGR